MEIYTILATNEFKYRYQSCCWDKVVKIYVNNIDKNLWEIDNMVVDFFIQDSIERVNFYLNDNPFGIEQEQKTKEQKDAQEWLVNNAKESSHQNIQWFKKLAEQKLTKVDTTKLIDTSLIKDLNNVMISYDAMSFGWVNVDYFYKDPKAVPIKLIVKTNKSAPLINLIISGRNVILNGSEHDLNEYWFTKKIDGYNKLPKGEKATIIAIGMHKTQLQFSEKEIVIGENEIENLEMKAISVSELKIQLEKYGS